jgi:hypothetical protein
MIKKVILSLMVAFILVGSCLAADSVTVSVSCTIPSVPGLNAPGVLDEKYIERPVGDNQASQEESITSASTEQIQKQESELRLAEGKTQAILVQTLYSK